METIANVDGVFCSTGASLAGAPDFTVYAVGRAGYVHSACYQELVEAVYFGLRQLGYRVALATSAGGIAGNTIVIGGHLLAPADIDALPPATVVYNTEHVRSQWFTPACTALVRRFPVWDYSEDNARLLREAIGRAARFVPRGYVPQFSRVPKAEQDIDVLFYGSNAPRRDALLFSESARRAGVPQYLDNRQVYGYLGRRDDHVALAGSLLAEELQAPHDEVADAALAALT